MPVGAGRYDDLVSEVMQQTKAQGCALLVLGGSKGSGFSVQAPYIVQKKLPALLRHMADEIEQSIEKGGLDN